MKENTCWSGLLACLSCGSHKRKVVKARSVEVATQSDSNQVSKDKQLVQWCYVDVEKDANVEKFVEDTALRLSGYYCEKGTYKDKKYFVRNEGGKEQLFVYWSSHDGGWYIGPTLGGPVHAWVMLDLDMPPESGWLMPGEKPGDRTEIPLKIKIKSVITEEAPPCRSCFGSLGQCLALGCCARGQPQAPTEKACENGKHHHWLFVYVDEDHKETWVKEQARTLTGDYHEEGVYEGRKYFVRKEIGKPRVFMFWGSYPGFGGGGWHVGSMLGRSILAWAMLDQDMPPEKGWVMQGKTQGAHVKTPLKIREESAYEYGRHVCERFMCAPCLSCAGHKQQEVKHSDLEIFLKSRELEPKSSSPELVRKQTADVEAIVRKQTAEVEAKLQNMQTASEVEEHKSKRTCFKAPSLLWCHVEADPDHSEPWVNNLADRLTGDYHEEGTCAGRKLFIHREIGHAPFCIFWEPHFGLAGTGGWCIGTMPASSILAWAIVDKDVPPKTGWLTKSNRLGERIGLPLKVQVESTFMHRLRTCKRWMRAPFQSCVSRKEKANQPGGGLAEEPGACKKCMCAPFLLCAAPFLLCANRKERANHPGGRHAEEPGTCKKCMCAPFLVCGSRKEKPIQTRGIEVVQPGKLEAESKQEEGQDNPGKPVASTAVVKVLVNPAYGKNDPAKPVASTAVVNPAQGKNEKAKDPKNKNSKKALWYYVRIDEDCQETWTKAHANQLIGDYREDGTYEGKKCFVRQEDSGEVPLCIFWRAYAGPRGSWYIAPRDGGSSLAWSLVDGDTPPVQNWLMRGQKPGAQVKLPLKIKMESENMQEPHFCDRLSVPPLPTLPQLPPCLFCSHEQGAVKSRDIEVAKSTDSEADSKTQEPITLTAAATHLISDINGRCHKLTVPPCLFCSHEHEAVKSRDIEVAKPLELEEDHDKEQDKLEVPALPAAGSPVKAEEETEMANEAEAAARVRVVYNPAPEATCCVVAGFRSLWHCLSGDKDQSHKNGREKRWMHIYLDDDHKEVWVKEQARQFTGDYHQEGMFEGRKCFVRKDSKTPPLYMYWGGNAVGGCWYIGPLLGSSFLAWAKVDQDMPPQKGWMMRGQNGTASVKIPFKVQEEVAVVPKSCCTPRARTDTLKPFKPPPVTEKKSHNCGCLCCIPKALMDCLHCSKGHTRRSIELPSESKEAVKGNSCCHGVQRALACLLCRSRKLHVYTVYKKNVEKSVMDEANKLKGDYYEGGTYEGKKYYVKDNGKEQVYISWNSKVNPALGPASSANAITDGDIPPKYGWLINGQSLGSADKSPLRIKMEPVCWCDPCPHIRSLGACFAGACTPSTRCKASVRHCAAAADQKFADARMCLGDLLACLFCRGHCCGGRSQVAKGQPRRKDGKHYHWLYIYVDDDHKETWVKEQACMLSGDFHEKGVYQGRKYFVRKDGEATPLYAFWHSSMSHGAGWYISSSLGSSGLAWAIVDQDMPPQKGWLMRGQVQGAQVKSPLRIMEESVFMHEVHVCEKLLGVPSLACAGHKQAVVQSRGIEIKKNGELDDLSQFKEPVPPQESTHCCGCMGSVADELACHEPFARSLTDWLHTSSAQSKRKPQTVNKKSCWDGLRACLCCASQKQQVVKARGSDVLQKKSQPKLRMAKERSTGSCASHLAQELACHVPLTKALPGWLHFFSTQANRLFSTQSLKLRKVQPLSPRLAYERSKAPQPTGGCMSRMAQELACHEPFIKALQGWLKFFSMQTRRICCAQTSTNLKLRKVQPRSAAFADNNASNVTSVGSESKKQEPCGRRVLACLTCRICRGHTRATNVKSVGSESKKQEPCGRRVLACLTCRICRGHTCASNVQIVDSESKKGEVEVEVEANVTSTSRLKEQPCGGQVLACLSCRICRRYTCYVYIEEDDQMDKWTKARAQQFTGKYHEKGIHDGRKYFVRNEGKKKSFYIFWSEDESAWCLGPTLGDSGYAWAEIDQGLPPLSGWRVVGQTLLIHAETPLRIKIETQCVCLPCEGLRSLGHCLARACSARRPSRTRAIEITSTQTEQDLKVPKKSKSTENSCATLVAEELACHVPFGQALHDWLETHGRQTEKAAKGTTKVRKKKRCACKNICKELSCHEPFCTALGDLLHLKDVHVYLHKVAVALDHCWSDVCHRRVSKTRKASNEGRDGICAKIAHELAWREPFCKSLADWLHISSAKTNKSVKVSGTKGRDGICAKIAHELAWKEPFCKSLADWLHISSAPTKEGAKASEAHPHVDHKASKDRKHAVCKNISHELACRVPFKKALFDWLHIASMRSKRLRKQVSWSDGPFPDPDLPNMRTSDGRKHGVCKRIAHELACGQPFFKALVDWLQIKSKQKPRPVSSERKRSVCSRISEELACRQPFCKALRDWLHFPVMRRKSSTQPKAHPHAATVAHPTVSNASPKGYPHSTAVANRKHGVCRRIAEELACHVSLTKAMCDWLHIPSMRGHRFRRKMKAKQANVISRETPVKSKPHEVKAESKPHEEKEETVAPVAVKAKSAGRKHVQWCHVSEGEDHRIEQRFKDEARKLDGDYREEGIYEGKKYFVRKESGKERLCIFWDTYLGYSGCWNIGPTLGGKSRAWMTSDRDIPPPKGWLMHGSFIPGDHVDCPVRVEMESIMSHEVNVCKKILCAPCGGISSVLQCLAGACVATVRGTTKGVVQLNGRPRCTNLTAGMLDEMSCSVPISHAFEHAIDAMYRAFFVDGFCYTTSYERAMTSAERAIHNDGLKMRYGGYLSPLSQELACHEPFVQSLEDLLHISSTQTRDNWHRAKRHPIIEEMGCDVPFHDALECLVNSVCGDGEETMKSRGIEIESEPQEEMPPNYEVYGIPKEQQVYKADGAAEQQRMFDIQAALEALKIRNARLDEELAQRQQALAHQKLNASEVEPIHIEFQEVEVKPVVYERHAPKIEVEYVPEAIVHPVVKEVEPPEIEGDFAIVKYRFVSDTMDSETISLEEGARVQVLYTEGAWAAIKTASGQTSNVPIVCLDMGGKSFLAPPDVLKVPQSAPLTPVKTSQIPVGNKAMPLFTSARVISTSQVPYSPPATGVITYSAPASPPALSRASSPSVTHHTVSRMTTGGSNHSARTRPSRLEEGWTN